MLYFENCNFGENIEEALNGYSIKAKWNFPGIQVGLNFVWKEHLFSLLVITTMVTMPKRM